MFKPWNRSSEKGSGEMSYKLSDGTEVTKDTPEDVIQNDCIIRMNKDFKDYLAIWRNNTGAMKVDDRFIKFGIPGQGDASGIITPGFRLEVEFKRKGKKQTKRQINFQKNVVEYWGGIYLLCDGNYNDQIKVPLMRYIAKNLKPYE